MHKTVGLIHGHYECRSLEDTLPVFTDLLALEIVERKDKEAIVKHPNTGWRLVVHEGGPSVAEKPHNNHYGFRVANTKEIPVAWKYLEAHKEQYGIKRVYEPTEAHYAYSVYFEEPGGNTLEIEYYNPMAAAHGRTVAARHWEKLITEEQFPGRGYIPQAMSHGTLQCDDKETSDRFYQEVLGLEIVGGGKTSTYISHPAGPWYIVVLPSRHRELLSPVNRFTLRLESQEAVEETHREFDTAGKKMGITDLWDLEQTNGDLSFIFSDQDKNWWEFTS